MGGGTDSKPIWEQGAILHRAKFHFLGGPADAVKALEPDRLHGGAELARLVWVNVSFSSVDGVQFRDIPPESLLRILRQLSDKP